jgi:hypothetical protein
VVPLPYHCAQINKIGLFFNISPLARCNLKPRVKISVACWVLATPLYGSEVLPDARCSIKMKNCLLSCPLLSTCLEILSFSIKTGSFCFPFPGRCSKHCCRPRSLASAVVCTTGTAVLTPVESTPANITLWKRAQHSHCRPNATLQEI